LAKKEKKKKSSQQSGIPEQCKVQEGVKRTKKITRTFTKVKPTKVLIIQHGSGVIDSGNHYQISLVSFSRHWPH
jgi:hypothetical protein